ncbi:polysaccharide lyase family 8 super-sandwich domain-containing protein [Cohnella hashimotonis]|uniref:Polysaccharide lyase family 8 super-sandwich domain-containing protein n=1 Tax=Cohnella hashimotonis TaxID=2826895 RepID=A0ABT6TLQ3_9BACL|nr:polysaccharide lyase family 8 super-sandwich domain-containing protein [Cohnella hashimotonis]MDI4647654.1 polysaccharide lyase family 8 super-sandwich domain-containing protein [Cohnella hashimotonis]
MKAFCRAIVLCALLLELVAPAAGGVRAVHATGAEYVKINYDEASVPKSVYMYAGTTYTGAVGTWNISNTQTDTDYVAAEQGPGRDAGDYSLHFVSSAKNVQTARNNLGGTTGLTGKLELDASLRVSGTSARRDIQLRSLNGGSTSATTNANVVSFADNGSINGADGQPLVSYAVDTWYDFKLLVDNANGTVDYFVNGAYLGQRTLPAGWSNVRHLYLLQTFKSGQVNHLFVDNVLLKDDVPVSGVSVPVQSLDLPVGESAALVAAALPADASDARLIWSSSDPDVAAVADGRVTGVAAGQAELTVVAADGGFKQTVTVNVKPHIAVQSVKLPATLTLAETASQVIEPVFAPVDTTEKALTWSSDAPGVAAVDAAGNVTAVSAGTAHVTATSVSNPSLSGTTEVTVTAEVKVDGIEILPHPAELMLDDTLQLGARVLPEDATNPDISWSSSDPSVLTVDAAGLATAKSEGSVTITAAATGKSATANIRVRAPELSDPEAYDKLRIRWRETLTGKSTLDPSDPTVKGILEANAQAARDYWSGMALSGSGGTLWSDLPASPTDSTFINTHYTRLKAMALAYATPGTSLYQDARLGDDIVAALDWLQSHLYTPTAAQYGNWWNWQIGVPNRLTDILILMYDELTPAQIKAAAASIDRHIGDIASPSFTQTGANRSDIMLIEVRLGLLEHNYKRLMQARDGMTPLFEYVTSGDGFYEDGSYVQHTTIAYTGSYGEVLIQGLGNLMLLLNGSDWQPVAPEAGRIYEWIDKGFAPILYKGQAIDMTRGRAIVRPAGDAYYSARNILTGIARIAQTAPASQAEALKALVKGEFAYQLQRGVSYYRLPLDLADTVKDWMNDVSIPAAEELPAHYELNGMARSIHQGSDYLFGVSKSSKRIATYELTNGENPKGWYTGDGMTYLYNSDLSQYADSFWATVDWKRLPGTTVAVRDRQAADYQNGDGETTPANSWAGGATLGSYGVTGMNLMQTGTSLNAYKSWFAFDDEIVALGAGISSGDSLPVETIVEQRKLKSDNANAFSVDGESMEGTFADRIVANARWAHLDGNAGEGSDIGYVFPDGGPLIVSRQLQEGRWSDIALANPPSATVPSQLLSDYYLTMRLTHGTTPSDETYQYVLLPGATEARTASYAGSPDVSIVANTASVQAVREDSLHATGFSFWRDEIASAGGLTSDRKASVMLREDEADGTVELAVADPTLENAGYIQLELDRSAAGLIAKDDRIEVLQLSPTVKLKANVKDTLGRSLTIALRLEGADPEQPGEPGEQTPKPSQEPTPTPSPVTPQGPTPTPSVEPTNAPGNALFRSGAKIAQAFEARIAEAGENPSQAKTPDDALGHWAEKTIDTFLKLQVLKGYADGTAKPNRPISRAEFVAVLDRLIDVESTRAAELRDIGGHWAHRAIEKFAAAGIVGGYGDGTFRPDRTISREEMIVLLSRIINLEAAAQTASGGSTGEFSDIGHTYAADAIRDAARAGIVDGRGEGRFDPSGNATRAEAMTVLLNMLNLSPDIQRLLATL